MRAPSSDPSPPSFEELYRATFGFVTRTLRRLGVSEAGLDDAIQDVYLVVHRRLDSFEGRSTPATWIYGIARRVAADHRRREVRQPEPVPELEVDGHDSPYERLAAAQGMEQIGRLLDELPEDRREVFVLAELEGLSGPEIARCLDLDLETVYWRLRKGRREWTSAIERYGAAERWRAQRVERGDQRRRRCWTALVVGLGLPARQVAAASGASSATAATGISLGIFAASGALAAAALVAIIAVSSPARQTTKAAPVAAGKGAPVAARTDAPTAAMSSPVVQPLLNPRAAPPDLATPSPGPGAAAIAPGSPPARRGQTPSPTLPGPAQPAPSPQVPASIDGALAAEAALLLQADEALRRGALGEAASRLRAHARQFPSGVLTRERETLDLARRCLAGQRQGIETAIDAHLRRYPGESARQILRRACDLDH
jgi:RNA polymerase sigma-70 factor, ECF subfamily